MKGLKTLVKLNKRELDEARRTLAVLEEERQKHIELAAFIYQEVTEERKKAAADPLLSGYLAAFVERAKKKQMQIAQEVIALDGQIAQQQARMAELFSETKKYDIAIEREKARLETEAALKEQQALSEMAMQQYRRQQEN